ncbi:MAG: glucosidase [Saprospiraceae bacterium]
MESQESKRLADQYTGKASWSQWGPYLSERQWGTVREDYSEHGNAWEYFSHDQARSRTYRWGEDGIAGISDDHQHICFALAMWNGKDPILKERLYGLTGNEGNHGEDVKELYYYLDATPTHSYLKHLYKYPINEYPYEWLVNANRGRSKEEREFEIIDTGIFDQRKYFDVITEYAKAGPNDICVRITVYNRSSERAPISLLPTLWFRNTWFSQEAGNNESSTERAKPKIQAHSSQSVKITHEQAGNYFLYYDIPDHTLFTENESNKQKLWNVENQSRFVKDAFHDAVVGHKLNQYNQQTEGTKFSPLYQVELNPGESKTIRLRLTVETPSKPFINFDTIFSDRINEANEFYAAIHPATLSEDQKNIQRQALAGMIWSKQFYYIDIPKWLNGDPGQVPPPANRKTGRNSQWHSLNNEDILSMPDKWEYPWYAAWDLAFHCIPLAMVDPEFAKNQLILLLREWYMHPNGQLPAYEWAFGDVNPPVHAWSCLQVYKQEKSRKGKGDVDFLKKVFQKLLINFTWWVNRKDHKGNNVFEGGFLGLDNIGLFDRSNQIPGGGHLEQADGTAWMAMYSLNMLEMALEIAQYDMTFEDVATKFFEHFIYIAESLNRIGHDWTGAWDDQEGFFYDVLALPDGSYQPLKVRSLVGLSTLFAVYRLPGSYLKKLTDFSTRLNWFKKYRSDNGQYLVLEEDKINGDILLSLVPKDRLEKLLNAMLNEQEFLSPSGIRAISKIHEHGYYLNINGEQFGLKYEPAESSSGLFGGNSNWRGPIWMPMNYLLIQALREFGSFYKESFTVSAPGQTQGRNDLNQVADDLSQRLISIFEADEQGARKVFGDQSIYREDPHFKDLVLFYEYFHGDTGSGVGASHQTGWTGLIADLISTVAERRKNTLKPATKKLKSIATV